MTTQQDALFMAHVWDTLKNNGYLTAEFTWEHTELIEQATAAADRIKEEQEQPEPTYKCQYCKDTRLGVWILDGKKYSVTPCLFCGHN